MNIYISDIEHICDLTWTNPAHIYYDEFDESDINEKCDCELEDLDDVHYMSGDEICIMGEDNGDHPNFDYQKIMNPTFLSTIHVPPNLSPMPSVRKLRLYEHGDSIFPDDIIAYFPNVTELHIAVLEFAHVTIPEQIKTLYIYPEVDMACVTFMRK